MSSLDESERELQPPPPRRASDPTPPWTRRLRTWIVPCVVAVLGVAGAWILLKQAGSHDAPPEASPPRSSARASSTPSPSKQAANTGPDAKSAADFEAIYTELQSTVSRAYDQYRPELLDDAFAKECQAKCRTNEKKTAIQEMAGAGARFRRYGPRVLLLRVIGETSGTILEGSPTRTVSIRLVDEQGHFDIVDRNGNVREQSDGWQPRSSVYRLYFSDTRKRWLILSIAVEGSADFILGPNWMSSPSEQPK